jgi:hypothetical protein
MGTLGKGNLIEMPGGQAPAWDQKLFAETMSFVESVQHNFAHYLKIGAEEIVPQDNTEYRKQVLDRGFEALCGVVVQMVCQYGSTGEGIEEKVIQAIRTKFEYVRTKQKEIAARNLQTTPE